MNPGVYPGFTAGIVQVGKPVRTTIYTSGTGTYRPTSTNAWCQITLVGGGGAGAAGSFNTFSGGAAGVFSAFVKLPGPVSYSVGAGGTTNSSTSGNNGGNTTLGTYTATGGAGGREFRDWITPASDFASSGMNGESSPFGNGGRGGTYNSATNGAAGGGYGSGGGAGGQQWASGSSNDLSQAGAGAGGLIIIEDFGP